MELNIKEIVGKNLKIKVFDANFNAFCLATLTLKYITKKIG